jgi:hypothetical protein
MKDEARLGHTIPFVLKALVSSYKENCPLKFVRAGTYSVRWTHIVQSLRKEVRRVFNKS